MDKENFFLDKGCTSKYPKSKPTFRLIDLNVSVEEQQSRKREGLKIDWNLCILCQSDANEELLCPSANKRAKKDEGIETLERNLREFHNFGKPVCKVDIQDLDSGPGIRENLIINEAKWHKNCFLKCTDSKLEKLRRNSVENVSPTSTSVISTRRSSGLNTSQESIKQICVFCESKGTRKTPLKRMVNEASVKVVMNQAVNRGDTKILVSLQGWQGLNGTWYHLSCRTVYLYEKKSAANDSFSASSSTHAYALAQVVSHINDVKNNTVNPPAFAMAQLTRMYESKLRERGVETTAHSTRLKEQLLEVCPFLEACGTAGQNSLVMFKKDVDSTVRAECAQPSDNYFLTKSADILRKAILDHKPPDWSEMTGDCSTQSTPAIVNNFLEMVLRGSSSSAEDAQKEQCVSTLAQLLLFHTSKRVVGKAHRHEAARETPVPVYVAAKLYGETRKKGLVDVAYRLGLSISYDRLRTILTERCNRACRQYELEEVVCPLSLEKGVFTTAAVDNIDHNTSSTTAKDSFHGTAISIMQHGPPGEPRTFAIQKEGKQRKLIGLPPSYTVVPVSFLDVKSARCPTAEVTTIHPSDPFEEEKGWLESSRNSLTCNTWSGYHSKRVPESNEDYLTRVSVLPVFREHAATVAMMAHSMGLAIKATDFLNSGQTAVLVCDLQTYVLCKEVQWLQPETLGESKLFLKMGDMHVELAALRVLGDWLDGSGWTNALLEAGVTSKGRAESMLSASHLTRTRYAHQVTAAVLYDLKGKAFEAYAGDDPLTYEQWCNEKRAIPQFRFWDIVLHLELVILKLVRSLRIANFHLYLEALALIAPWFFALDHHNYARWLPVHIRDLMSLEKKDSNLWEMFQRGYFVAKKTPRAFSTIPLDQAHEQVNAALKGSGGMIGLTENPTALLKWMLSAPELADIACKFEDNILNCVSETCVTHHSDKESARSSFLRDKLSLTEVFEKAGNPFLEDSLELYNIDTRHCCSENVKKTVMNVEAIGKEQYDTYVEERLKLGSVCIHSTIKQNQLPTFGFTPKKKEITKAKALVKSLKNDTRLFGQMCVAISSNRPAHLEELFSRENQEFPPALACERGMMRSNTKSELLNKCLLPLVETAQTPPVVHVKILDGAAMINMLKPDKVSVLFSDYVKKVFIPFITDESKYVSRLDIVWDMYLVNSLKSSTRKKRGEGTRIRVAKDTKLPTNWANFLRNSENKAELFEYLAQSVQELHLPGTAIYSNCGEKVVSNVRPPDCSSISLCNHEEADTRIFVHIADAARNEGYTKFMIRASDTDIVVLAVYVMIELPEIEELWIFVVAGKKRYIPAHEIYLSLGPDTSAILPVFHAFSGSDNTSAFFGIGKKTAWDTLKLLSEVTTAFKALTCGDVTSGEKTLQNFVMTMYSPATSYDSLSHCRRALFAAKKRGLDSIPPTEDALQQHLLRTSYQAQVWTQLTTPIQNLPSPADWGWRMSEDGWIPVWRKKPVMADASLTLVSCKCKKECRGNCKCKKTKQETGCCDLCTCPCKKTYQS